jgi:hypothetical protein
MNRKSLRGVSIMEFALSMLVMVPLLLGTIGIGIQLIQSMQTIQLARDAARMYGRGLDFSQPGNKTILAAIGSDLGLHTADTGGTAVVILSTVKYIDATICPTGCTNLGQWVFYQRLVIGNPGYRTSNLGSPLVVRDSHFSAVTLDSKGIVSPASQMTNNANDVAVFSTGGNPFITAGALTDLPSGTVLYVSEAASQGFKMPPFASGGMLYAYNVF